MTLGASFFICCACFSVPVPLGATEPVPAWVPVEVTEPRLRLTVVLEVAVWAWAPATATAENMVVAHNRQRRLHNEFCMMEYLDPFSRRFTE